MDRKLLLFFAIVLAVIIFTGMCYQAIFMSSSYVDSKKATFTQERILYNYSWIWGGNMGIEIIIILKIPGMQKANKQRRQLFTAVHLQPSFSCTKDLY